jgi:uncharacterized Zn finger protein
MSGARPSSMPGWANGASVPRRADVPRKVRNGLKLQLRWPLSPHSIAADHWLRLLESRVPADELATGYEYARLGQTVNMEFQPGVVTAQVQGTAARPHHVELRLATLTEQQWSEVILLMASEAIHAAKLLAGELPPSFDKVLSAAGASLFGGPNSVAFQCDCSLPRPCRHAAAVAHLVAEQLETAPLQVLTLLGMPAERVLDRLRHERSQHADAAPSDHVDPLIPQSMVEPPPLEACVDEYWHALGGSHSPEVALPTIAHAPHALLRRLGPSPLQGRFPMVGLLASIYDTVSQAARGLRDADSTSSAGSA